MVNIISRRLDQLHHAPYLQRERRAVVSSRGIRRKPDVAIWFNLIMMVDLAVEVGRVLDPAVHSNCKLRGRCPFDL